MLFNKKASLEISIQAIVIVVLAMTLLGLGLGFIRNMIKNLTGTTEDVTEQVREQILNDLRTGDKKISFPKTEISVEKGGSTVLNVGVKNQNNDELSYKIKFCAISGPDPTGLVEPTNDCNLHSRWFQIPTPKDGWILDNAESDIRSIRVSIPKSEFSGSYAFTFEVTDESVTGVSYAQKDFFIVVTG